MVNNNNNNNKSKNKLIKTILIFVKNKLLQLLKNNQNFNNEFNNELNTIELADNYRAEANKNYQKANYYLIIAKGLIENNLKSQDSVKINLVEFSYNQKLAEQQQISKDRKRNVIYLIIGIVVLAVAIIIILVII